MVSDKLKAYIYLERASEMMGSVDDDFTNEILSVMDSVWYQLSFNEIAWLNERNFAPHGLQCPCEL